jgi:hypothetical protein
LINQGYILCLDRPQLEIAELFILPIHRHKAASRNRRKLAGTRPSPCIKINVGYRETLASVTDPNQPINFDS